MLHRPAILVCLALSTLAAAGCCGGSKNKSSGAAPSATRDPSLPPDPVAIHEGQLAPDVDLPLASGKTIKLSSLRGKQVALYFYPKDNTPGCTVEAQELRDAWAELQKADVTVVGVSTQDAASHKAFIDQEKLPFELAIDADHKIAKAFEVDVRNGLADRQTFLIDKDGKLKKVWRAVEPKGHAAQILAAAKGPAPMLMAASPSLQPGLLAAARLTPGLSPGFVSAASPSLQPGLVTAARLTPGLSPARFTDRPGLRHGLGA